MGAIDGSLRKKLIAGEDNELLTSMSRENKTAIELFLGELDRWSKSLIVSVQALADEASNPVVKRRRLFRNANVNLVKLVLDRRDRSFRRQFHDQIFVQNLYTVLPAVR